MPKHADTLPKDHASLEALVLSQRSQIEYLSLLVAKLQRQQFGRRAESHPASPDQIHLGLHEQDQESTRTPLKVIPEAKSERRRPSRKPLPAHLPRDIQLHGVDDEAGCPQCGGDLRRIGEDVSEMLEVYTGPLPCDPPCAPQTGLRLLCDTGSGRGTRTPDCAWHRGPGPVGPCTGLQIL